MKMMRNTAWTLAKASGLLLFAYVAIFVAAHANGYYFRPTGGTLEFTTTSGKRYALFHGGYWQNYGDGWGLYQVAGSTGFFWQLIPDVKVGYSYNDYHRGTDLVASPDGKLLFIRRNTDSSSPAGPIWTDVLDLTSDPPTIVIRGPDCCMEIRPGHPTETDSEGLQLHGLKVLDFARIAGAVN
ncbi:hypothetical protein [Mesorhizobium sp. ANAO-SY3R2]|uniref:hypothetical protein n=1 Tax=Mesorhizobium sp. ANAO-SY3R2 TaxID=3166644 RepID=UPI00366F7A83